MNRLCCFVGATVFGYAGWFAGEALGLGLFGAFGLSGVASVIGVYLGWKVARRFE